MNNYSFIDPEQEYDADELWDKLSKIGGILEEHCKCMERLRSVTGNVFRTEEEREKSAELINGYYKSRGEIAEIVRNIPPETIQQAKTALTQISYLANIQRSAQKNESILISMLNKYLSFRIKHRGIPEEVRKIILSSHLFVKTTVCLYNNLLASLVFTKSEIERQKNKNMEKNQVEETCFVWHHNGQRVSPPYAVAMLMTDMGFLKDMPVILELLNVLLSLTLETNTKGKEEILKMIDKIQKGRDDVFADTRSLYREYTEDEIKHQADIFKQNIIFVFLGLELPDEETVSLAMEGEYEIAERLLTHKAGEKIIDSEDINKKYGYKGNGPDDGCDMEL